MIAAPRDPPAASAPAEEKDTFTFHVMQRIPGEVRAALTPAQMALIQKAIYESRPGQNHALDARITLPLFFAKFYLVLQAGRDRRSSTRRAEDRRKKIADKAFDWTVFAILLFNAIQILFLILYAFKTVMGINLMPHDHLLDLLPDL
jgi:hypothetical protein